MINTPEGDSLGISADTTLDDVRHEATAERHRVVRQVVSRARARGEPLPPDGAHGIIRSIAVPLFYRCFIDGVAPTRTLADRCVQRALAPTCDVRATTTGHNP